MMDYELIASVRKAVEEGEVDAVRSFLDSGGSADVIIDIDTETPILQHAVACNQKEIVWLLLARGADVDGTDDDYATALHAACGSTRVIQDPAIVDLLLGAGADIKAPDFLGMTPLHSTFACGPMDNVEPQKGLIRLLIDKGADLDAHDQCGGTPWFIAFPNLSLLTFLVDELGVDVCTHRDGSGQTMLFRQAYLTQPDVVKLFLARGMDVKARDIRGSTVLHSATSCTAVPATEAGFVTSFGLLLEAGADINAVDESGWRPIHCACSYGMVEHIIMLIQWGAYLGGAPPAQFPYESLEAALAARLTSHVNKLRAEHKPLTRSTAWLKWLVSSPAVPTIGPASPSSSPPSTGDEATATLRDNAWERRKHLVHSYFETRRLRKEGGTTKKAKEV